MERLIIEELDDLDEELFEVDEADLLPPRPKQAFESFNFAMGD